MAMAMARNGDGCRDEGIDVQFVPPREREVGKEAVAILVLRPTCELERAEVRVEAARGMTVANAREAGVVFDGPLEAGRRTTVALRLVAAKPGRQELHVTVQTDPPEGSTHLDVAMPGFAAAAERVDETGARLRRDISLSVRDRDVSEALAEVGREAGLELEISPSVAGRTVSVDLQKVPAEAAIRILCQDAGCRMERSEDKVRVYRP
jgi:hypothetical protein